MEILRQLHTSHTFNIPELAAKVNASEETLGAALEQLIAMGYLERDEADSGSCAGCSGCGTQSRTVPTIRWYSLTQKAKELF